MENHRFLCPVCKSNQLMVKYEAKYVYSYVIDNDAPGERNSEEFLPFLFDRRDQTEARQYIECSTCGVQYPCFFSQGTNGLDFKILHQVLDWGNLVDQGATNSMGAKY